MEVVVSTRTVRNQTQLVEQARQTACLPLCDVRNDIPWKRIQSEESRLEIALLLVDRNAWDIANNIKKLGLTSEQSRYTLARGVASADPHAAADTFEKFGLTSRKHKLEVVGIIAELNGLAYCSLARRLTDLNDRQKLRLALKAAAQNGHAVSENIESLGVNSKSGRFAVAKVCAQSHPLGFARFFERYGFDDGESRLALALIVAAAEGGAVMQHLKSFDLSDKQQRRVLRVAVTSSPLGVMRNLYRATGLGHRFVVSLARKALLNCPYAHTEIRNNLSLSETEMFRRVTDPAFTAMVRAYSSEKMGNSARAQLYKSLRRHFTESLDQNMSLVDELGLDLSGYEELSLSARLRYTAAWLRDAHPILDESLIDYERELATAELMPAALAATLLTWDDASPDRYDNRARAALARLTGYRDIPRGHLSSNAARELWGVMISAYEIVEKPLSEVLPLRLKGVTPALAYKAVMMVATLHGLGGKVPQFSSPLMSDKQIEEACDRLLPLINDAMSRFLGVQELPEEKIFSLLERWGGDLTVFGTLAARLSANNLWRAEVPVLREIGRHIVQDTYHDWRYRRDDDQLTMLSLPGLDAWRRNPMTFESYSVRVKGAEEAQSTAGRVVRYYQDSLAPLLHSVCGLPKENVDSSVEQLRQLLALPEKLFTQQVRTLDQAAVLVSKAVSTYEPSLVAELVARINNNKQGLFAHVSAINAGAARGVSEGLLQLKRIAKGISGLPRESYYVLSTLSDDPKLLLMTGELVQAWSCLSYRTGSNIDALPANATDGNLKLALSYAVSRHVVQRALDRLGVPDSSLIYAGFDHPRQLLILRRRDRGTQGRESAVEISLGSAIRREVIRLGVASDGAAVLLTDKAYTQSHCMGETAEGQQRQLIAAHAQEIGARLYEADEGAVFPASRNPAGVYTDGGRGAVRGRYVM